jgi:hypothetical protein
MSDEEIKKILLELREKRKSNSYKTTSIAPTGSANMISGGVVGMDFASLYPSTMTIHFPAKWSIQNRRKKKIKRLFNER